MNLHPQTDLTRDLPPNDRAGAVALIAACVLLAVVLVLMAFPAHGQPPRHRAVRPTVPTASVFESVPLPPLFRTNLRYLNLPTDPLDLPTAACRIEAHWQRPGGGAGSQGVTWFLPTIDTSCGGDPERYIFRTPLVPIPEFDGENGAGPWVTLETCDTLLITVHIERDLPGTGDRLWVVRTWTKCWHDWDVFAPVGRRRATR